MAAGAAYRLERAEPSPEVDRDALAARLSESFAGAEAGTILRAALLDVFPERIALVSSFGAESAPLLHLVAQVNPGLPVIFLDTGKHFSQTLSHRKKLAARLGLTNVLDIRPGPEALAREDQDGSLWRHDADGCCTLRKVQPLNTALAGFAAWITGRKAFHGGERLRLPIFEATDTHIKVNPLIGWQADDIEAYRVAHDLPAHPLVEQGYPSVGCWPCTHPVTEGADVRAGRWRGQAKTECGIHRA